MSSWSRKARIFWPLCLTLLLADCTTKRIAEDRLAQEYVSHPVVGDVVTFTLAYNPGIAFGLPVGNNSRFVILGLVGIALLILAGIYRSVADGDRWKTMALALIFGGAVGNALDRVISPRGVVDFIDVGVGSFRFWTFNIADIGVTSGAMLLAWLYLREGAEPEGPGGGEQATT
jgi:signal peptidase II